MPIDDVQTPGESDDTDPFILILEPLHVLLKFPDTPMLSASPYRSVTHSMKIHVV